MRVAVWAGLFVVFAAAAVLVWRWRGAQSAPADAVVVAVVGAAQPAAPPSVPPVPPVLPAVPTAPAPAPPGCGLTSWDELDLQASPPATDNEHGDAGDADAHGGDVDDHLIGPAMAAAVKLGVIKAGACAGAEVYRYFGPVDLWEGGCVDGGRILFDGRVVNTCDNVDTESRARRVGYVAVTTTTATLLSSLGNAALLPRLIAERTVNVDATSRLPGLPWQATIPEPDLPTWALVGEAYSDAHARAVGILDVPCLSPRPAPEGVFRRCGAELRLTRPDGALAIYTPEPFFIQLANYEECRPPADLNGFEPFVPKNDLDAEKSDSAAADEPGLRTVHDAGHRVAVLKRSAADVMLKSAKDAVRQRADADREAREAFLAITLDDYLALQPAVTVTDRYGRSLYFVRVLIDLEL